MGFLGDIANSGIGSDLLSLYNAQKEVESRDALRQIQQQQLEEKKRAGLEREAQRQQELKMHNITTGATLFKAFRDSGDYEGAANVYKTFLQPHIPGATYSADKDGEKIEIQDVGGTKVLVHKRGANIKDWRLMPVGEKGPKTLENILASNVDSGEMTLEQAMALKKKHEPTPPNPNAITPEERKEKQRQAGYDRALNNFNNEVQGLWNRYHSSVNTGLPMSTEEWNSAYKSIIDRYSPQFKKYGGSLESSIGQGQQEASKPDPLGIRK